MITDRIGLLEVLLPINHSYYKLNLWLLAFSVFKVKTLNIQEYFTSGEKEKTHPRVCMHNGDTVQLHILIRGHDTCYSIHCSIKR